MNQEGLICKAILEKRQIYFFYDGEIRILEPHAYGKRDGSPRLLAYQVGGNSSSGKPLGWRHFELDKAGYFSITTDGFKTRQVEAPKSWTFKIAVVR